MKIDRLDGMTRGWFVGHFAPSVYDTKDVEVGVKTYRAGETEGAHHHKIATEITTVISGEIEMNGRRCVSGDIVTLSPGESCRFRSLTDSVTVVVKVPSAAGDKYLDE